jgi:hypothetical protein
VDPSIEDRQKSAIESAESILKSSFPDLIHSVFGYGAIDIDPRHLVVWVMLKGRPEDIPARAFPPNGPVWHLDPARTAKQRELIPTIVAMAGIVRECFRDVGWPDAHNVSVGFDSDERVERFGGWTYFK